MAVPFLGSAAVHLGPPGVGIKGCINTGLSIVVSKAGITGGVAKVGGKFFKAPNPSSTPVKGILLLTISPLESITSTFITKL